MTTLSARDVALQLLAARATGATVCPSEVARAMAMPTDGGAATVDWRNLMPTVHAAVDVLIHEGLVQLSWKGERLPSRRSPYRIGRGSRTIRPAVASRR